MASRQDRLLHREILLKRGMSLKKDVPLTEDEQFKSILRLFIDNLLDCEENYVPCSDEKSKFHILCKKAPIATEFI